jgi:hypothetical protein
MQKMYPGKTKQQYPHYSQPVIEEITGLQIYILLPIMVLYVIYLGKLYHILFTFTSNPSVSAAKFRAADSVQN